MQHVRSDERLKWEPDGSLHYSRLGDHLVESVYVPREDGTTPDQVLAEARRAWDDAIEASNAVFAAMIATSKYNKPENM